MIAFGTKAETLGLLEGVLKDAIVLPQLFFTVGEWKKVRGGEAICNPPAWLEQPVIVRSSSLKEDSSSQSLAGRFTTVSDVTGEEELLAAINVVVESMQSDNLDDQVLIQPMLKNVAASGVAFSRDPSNGGNYYIINYDDESGSTSSVTDGLRNDLKVHYCVKGRLLPESDWIEKVLSLLKELEQLFDSSALDIEFAIDQKGSLILLQVRPLVINASQELTIEEQNRVIGGIEECLTSLSKPHPYLLGDSSVFGVMPDWNPAEIIGVRPRPLSLSLYKELVTDNIWAYQRDNYGYRNLRSFPLLINLSGLPYIDVRVSFNSFIPNDLNEELADRLVNHYIQCLLQNPNLHDKVEFEIIYSCYTLDLPQRLEELKKHGFSEGECHEISEGLRKLTNEIIHGVNGLWKKDTAKIEELKGRQDIIGSSQLKTTDKLYWLLEDCKRYGTLPFAGLARTGFIAVNLLKSLVSVGVFSVDEYECFMGSLNTVSSRLSHDLTQLSREEFLEIYGFLRPGAYDILSPRYDEAPEQYFDWKNISSPQVKSTSSSGSFSIGLKTMNKLKELLLEHKLDHDALSLLNFIKEAIEGREYAKFIFTKSLSAMLVLMRQLGEKLGISAEDLSYADINVIRRLYSSSDNVKDELVASIEAGKNSYLKTCALTLPPLITSPENVWSFELPKNDPNFITQQYARGYVVDEHCERTDMLGSILMLPSADPGYDWIFSHGIGGFITMYGGVNSHMAIRAGELNVPAVIGAGESMYRKWASAQLLEVNCANKQVRILR